MGSQKLKVKKYLVQKIGSKILGKKSCVRRNGLKKRLGKKILKKVLVLKIVQKSYGFKNFLESKEDVASNNTIK